MSLSAVSQAGFSGGAVLQLWWCHGFFFPAICGGGYYQGVLEQCARKVVQGWTWGEQRWFLAGICPLWGWVTLWRGLQALKCIINLMYFSNLFSGATHYSIGHYPAARSSSHWAGPGGRNTSFSAFWFFFFFVFSFLLPLIEALIFVKSCICLVFNHLSLKLYHFVMIHFYHNCISPWSC